MIFLGVLVIYAPLIAGYTYLRDRLSLQWRKWLTHRFVDNYFDHRAYYNLHIVDTEIDNPDQRIAEDVRSFTQESLTFLLVLVESVLLVGLGGVIGMGLARVILPGLASKAQGMLPATIPLQTWIVGAVLIVLIGLVVGVLPALRAKRLKIVDALAGR